jgi:hypothetical protein
LDLLPLYLPCYFSIGGGGSVVFGGLPVPMGAGGLMTPTNKLLSHAMMVILDVLSVGMIPPMLF